MSDDTAVLSEDVPSAPSSAPSASTAGALLRQAREDAGLHIAALAVSLKVPVKKLEALEANRFDLLPDAVFVRALAASVCRSLKTDPAPVLALLPQTGAHRLIHDTSGINAPFRAPSDGPGPTGWDHVSRPAVIAVFILLLAALLLVFLPDIRQQMTLVSASMESPGEATTPAEMPAAELPSPPGFPADGSANQTGGQATPAQVASSPANTLGASDPAAALSALPSMVLSPSVALSTPTIASPPLPGTASPVQGPVTPATAASAGPAAEGIVVFKTRVESWVEVRDARGNVALRRVLGPGETAGVSGALPLSVVVGRADSTQVQVRGKPVDLAPLSRDNVARFEVK